MPPFQLVGEQQKGLMSSVDAAPQTQAPVQPDPTLQQTPQPTISASALANPAPSVTVPPPQIAPPPDTGTAKNVANQTQQFITAQSEEAKQLRERQAELAGLTGGETLQDLYQSQLSAFGADPQTMKELQDIQLQLNDMATESGVAQTRIAYAPGQTMAQAGREVTQEQREAAVRSAGLAARASVLQGNVETASQLASQAVQFAYQDRAFKNSNLISQINSLQGVVDDQTAQLLEKDKRQYERENLQMVNAVASVNSAVASGFASAQDVEAMTALSGDPEAQKAYADKIIAKATRTQYQNALAATRAAAAKAAASATDAKTSAALENGVFVEKAQTAIDTILANSLGVKAATGGTSLGRTSLSAGFETGAQGFVGGTGVGAGVGSVVPGVGTVAGGATGGVLGFFGGLATGTMAASSQKTNVMGALNFLTNSTTFAEMRRLKQSGVTFGSLTEGERKAIGASAENLISILEVDDSGQVTDIKATEDVFRQYLNDYQTRMVQYQDELVREAGGLSPEDIAAIDAAQN